MTRTERTFYLVFGGYTVAGFAIGPIYPLFLLSRGLDLFQINVVLAVYLITVFLFEVPTGAVADVFGRKASFLLSCVIRMGAYALYARAADFTDCLIAEFIDAIGTTLASGALEAWAVDGVRAEGDRRPTDRLFARAQVIARTLMIAGGVACGYLADLGFAWPWLGCALLFGLTAVVGAVLMREPPPGARGTSAGPRSFGRTVLAGLTTVGTAPVLLLLCLLTLAAAFAAFPMHMFWQPRIQALTGEGFWLLGWVLALLNLASLAGSALLPRLLGRFGRQTVLAGAAVWRAATLTVAATAAGIYPALAGLLLQEIAFGLSEPVLSAWTNEHIAPAERATALSVRSTFLTLGGAAGLVSIGLVARGHGISVAWLVSAAVFLLTAPGYLLLGRLAAARVAENPGEAVGVLPTKASPPGLS